MLASLLEPSGLIARHQRLSQFGLDHGRKSRQTGVGNVAHKSSSYGWDRRSNRNCGCLFYELRSELIVGTDRDHVDL